MIFKTIRACVISTVLLTGGAVAQAQYGHPGGPYGPEGVGQIIGRIHADLSAGYASWHLNGGDRSRLNHAEKHLHEFAERWRKGEFDKGRLDDAIGSIQHVINDNHLAGAERDNLWRDVSQLRSMREAYNRHEIGRW